MFYDEISEYYDQMIPFEKRVLSLQNQLGWIVDKYEIISALDAGSATGATCIALSNLGVKTVGIELSKKMVQIAKRHRDERGLDIDFRQSDLLKIRKSLRDNFDAIFIIANTISHFMDKTAVAGLLKNFRQWLRPGGIVLVQLLNYARIFRERERIVKIYNNNDRIFVRFYDFEKNTLHFNLLTIENSPGTGRHSLNSVPLRGWKPSEIKEALKKAGFMVQMIMGDLSGREFSPFRSTDFIVIARKKS